MLTKTMTQIKRDLDDMHLYVKANCKSKSARVGLLSVINDVKKDIAKIDKHIAKGEYLSAFYKISGHLMPRQEGFYIKRNYDYGEFWPAALDAFREGKVKDVVEMSRALRRWDPKDTKHTNWKENGVHIDTSVNNPDEKSKKIMQRASEETLFHLDSYCDKEKNKEYWAQMLVDEEHNEAVEDFLEYIQEVKC